MAFSSVPLYLDPPNWQQGNEIQNPPLPPTKPGSMGDRARVAVEGPLRCPRPGCESTNTKFCYYNNYNRSQPRHFCKACRRYWTRGGALRNVPVGGACRRNKRHKPKSPKPASAAGQPQQQQQQVVMQPVSAPSPYSMMTSLGMGNLGQLGYGGQQQVSFLAGLTAPSYNSGYPFQLREGGMETASFGKTWGGFGVAHIENRNSLGNGSGGLWTDLSGIN